MFKPTIILLFIYSLMACHSEKSVNDEAELDSLKKTSQENFEALKKSDLKQIGNFYIGMNASAVLQELGQPASKTKSETWPADGWKHQDWLYPEKGIQFNMIQQNDDTTRQIFSITLTVPAIFKTKKQIGIGNSYNEISQAYQNEIDQSASSEKLVVVGSLNGGLIIYLHNNKVIRLVAGTSTE